MKPQKRQINLPVCHSCKLLHHTLMHFLTKEELDEVTENKCGHFYPKKSIIFREGVFPSGVYCLYSGKVKLFRFGVDGKEQVLRLYGPGELIGYRALVSNEPYSAYAETIEDTYMCFIKKDVFLKHLQENPKFANAFMQLLSKDLKHAEDLVTDIAHKNVRERLATALLLLKELYGTEDDNQTLKVTLTRSDIAGIIGTATETAIRTLLEFKDDKIIELRNKKIKILDPKRLERIANAILPY